MKKFFALLLAICMVFALTACGGSVDAGKLDEILSAVKDLETAVDNLAGAAPAAPAAEAPAEEAAAPEEPAGEQTVLTMWCIATESDANRPAYEKAIAAFEEAHPDIKIEWEAFENESYKTKIKAAMNAGTDLGCHKR